jgi:predicted outer membrane protein
MKRSSLGLVIAICAVHAGLAHASAGDDAAKPPARGAVSAAARPGMFAAASAPFVRRLTPEQRDEWRFLKDAAATSRFAHEAARMALAKSGDPNVRSLAATLVNHYGGAQGTLQHMLHARNMAPPMLANDQRKVLNHLAKLQGAKFDREWMEEMGLHAQQDDVAAYEHAAAVVRDPQLRGWIARTLPTMRYQLAVAERAATGTTKYARLAPSVTSAAIKSPAPATVIATSNPSDLGEGNMVLGPVRSVAAKHTESTAR